MTLDELYMRFCEAFPGIEIFYSHIVVEEDREVYPPFVVIHETSGEPFSADNVTYWIGVRYLIDVYQSEIDIDFRKSIMKFLTDNELGYTVDFENIDEETFLYTDTYDIQLDE